MYSVGKWTVIGIDSQRVALNVISKIFDGSAWTIYVERALFYFEEKRNSSEWSPTCCCSRVPTEELLASVLIEILESGLGCANVTVQGVLSLNGRMRQSYHPSEGPCTGQTCCCLLVHWLTVL